MTSEVSFDGGARLDRKLSEDEIRDLRITLLPYFHAEGGMEIDDINDFLDYTFTMVSNNKTVEYIVGELNGFCSPEASKKIGKEIADRILQLNSGVGAGAQPPTEKGIQNKQSDDKKTSSTKASGEKGNALTMSGALGASREGGRNKKESHQKQKKNGERHDLKAGKERDHNAPKNDRRDGKRGRGTERPSETFDRLTKHNDRRDTRNASGRGRGRGRSDQRGGRGDRGGRGGRGWGGREPPQNIGHRRDRDDFENQAFNHGGGGRGGRGGRGRDGSKRPRYNDGYDQGYGHDYDDGYGSGYYHGEGHFPPTRGGFGRSHGPGRGRFGGRGGRGPGRGRGPEGDEVPFDGDNSNFSNNANVTEGEGAAHPSPMVQAAFGGRGGYGGFRGRGFSRGGRGRGRFGGRAIVVNKIQSKTWVRKKEDEGGNGGSNENVEGSES